MMEEQLITFETAKLAYNKRFDWIKSDNKWYEDNGDLDFSFQGYDENTENKITAPTQSLLQKWLREEHNIIVEVRPIEWYSPKFVFHLFIWNKGNIIQIKRTEKDLSKIKWEFFNYEKVLEKGLQQALKLI